MFLLNVQVHKIKVPDTLNLIFPILALLVCLFICYFFNSNGTHVVLLYRLNKSTNVFLVIIDIFALFHWTGKYYGCLGLFRLAFTHII